MVIDYTLLGKRLAAVRKSKHNTQERLAEITELTNNYISNIENCRSIPSLETLMKLCGALEVTPNELLMGVAPKSSNYLNDDLAEHVADCTPREKRLIIRFIDMLKDERE